MLSNDFENAALSDFDVSAIIAGVNGLSNFGAGLGQTGSLVEPLRFLKAPGGTELRLGGLINIGQTLQEQLANPIADFLATTPIANRTSDALVGFLDQRQEVVSIVGGFTHAPTDELRFQIDFQFIVLLNSFGVDFGSSGSSLGLSTDKTIQAAAVATLNLSVQFGVERDPDLNIEQAFFVQDTSMNISFGFHGTTSDFGMNVGFLDASARSTTVLYDVNAHVTFNDTVLDFPNRVKLFQLNGNDASDLAIVDLTRNAFIATVPVTATVGTWTSPGSPSIRVVGKAIGLDPAVTTNNDFAELLNFTHTTSEDLILGLDQIGSWLSAFSSAALLDVPVPFTKSSTLGSSYDLGKGFATVTQALRGADGLPVFDSAQTVPNLSTLIGYDPVEDRLTYVVAKNLPSQQTSASGTRVAVKDAESTLGTVNTSVNANVSSHSTVSFALGIDLTDQSLPLDQRITVTRLRMNATIESSAVGLSGVATYGDLAISFADGSLVGEHAYLARIKDPNNNTEIVSIANLFQGLNSLEDLLVAPLQFSGSSELMLSGLTVRDGLF